MDMDSSNAVVHPGTLSLSPSIDPLVLIISDAIKQAMESSTTAQQQSIAAMAEKNSMDTLVAQISETLASHGGHIFLHPPHSCPPSPSAHTILVAAEMICMPPSTGTYHSGCLQEHYLCCAGAAGIKSWRGAHTDLSLTNIAPGNSGCYIPLQIPVLRSQGSSLMTTLLLWLPVITTTIVDPSTVASSVQHIKKQYHSEDMTETINIMWRRHMERSPLGHLLEKHLRPSNIYLQMKQVNEEIYSRQGGQMSNEREG